MSPPVRPVLVAVALVVATLTSACGSTPSDPGTSATTPAPAPSTPDIAPSTPPPPSPSGSVGGTPVPTGVRERLAVRTALEDAAARQRVDIADVTVTTFTAVTWSDGSLGCPREGMAYTQALVEGELLVVEAAGVTMQYHGRTGGPYTYCADPTTGYAVGG